MSKTKKEIIAANTKTAFDNTWTDYDKAMDEYAAQVLSEYKNTLIHTIKDRAISEPITDIGMAHNQTIKQIIELI